MYPEFYNGRFTGTYRARGPEERIPPQMLMQNVKLEYNYYRFPVQNFRFNQYRIRAWTIFLCKHTTEKSTKNSVRGN